MKSSQEKKISARPVLWRWWLVGLVVAIGLACLMRLPFFPNIPAGLNRDEAALGYNAYSLLKTGRDEYGKSWPVSITSFGDQKLPGYVYTLIPFITIFDLNTFSVRLPSFIAGFIVIIGMGVLALQLAKEIEIDPKLQVILSTLTMIFLAISPWALHFSHVAYEAHLAMAAFIVGVVAYTYAMTIASRQWQRALLIMAALLWSSTLLTYHSYHVLTPLFILALLIIDFDRIKKADKIGLIAAWGIGVATILILYFGGVFQANQVKSQGISPFRVGMLRQEANEYRRFLPGENSVFDKILVNPVTEGITVFSQNVVTEFSGTFFFVHGSGHGDHNPGNMNNFPLFIAPLLFFSSIVLWQFRQKKIIQRVVVWFGAGCIPAALTITPQLEVRLSPIFPLLLLFAALTAVMIWMNLKKGWIKRGVVVLSVVIVLLSIGRTCIQYFYLIPERIVSNERYHILARALEKYQRQGYETITQSPTSSPYIWYLVENKFDPALLNSVIKRYPVDVEGFIHVKKVGNVDFETIQWDDLYERAKVRPLILIFQSKEITDDQRQNPRMHFLEGLDDSTGKLEYEVWKLDNTSQPVPVSSAKKT